VKGIDRRGMLRLGAAGAAAAAGTVSAPPPEALATAKPDFIILSCDGGGVRGLITAMLLADLNPAFLRKVSLYAGTSTGSIIALGLAAGVPIGQIVDLYRSMANCQEIFKPYLSAAEVEAARASLRAALASPATGPSPQIDVGKILQLVEEILAQLAYPKYQSTGLKSLLAANLPSLTLKDLASQFGKWVVAPSFQINGADAAGGWRPVLFHNLPGLDTLPNLSGTSLVDAAMCSAAAPLFFPPHDIAQGAFVDGGVAANDPCAAAIAAALASSLGSKDGLGAAAIAAVSIGTGNTVNFFPPASAVFPFGILGWMWPYQQDKTPAFPLIETLFAGSSGIGDLISAMLLRQSTYIRVNPVFAESFSLDECAAIDQISDLTKAYLETDAWQNFKTQIDALAG
jgi:uncharacterized protein